MPEDEEGSGGCGCGAQIGLRYFKRIHGSPTSEYIEREIETKICNAITRELCVCARPPFVVSSSCSSRVWLACQIRFRQAHLIRHSETSSRYRDSSKATCFGFCSHDADDDDAK